MSDEPLTQAAHDCLEKLAETTFESWVRGANDTTKLSMRMVDYPDLTLTVTPVDLFIDGDYVAHETLADTADITVKNGQYLHIGTKTEIKDFEVVRNGPGPAALNIELITKPVRKRTPD
jgi:hypothetical protein